MSNQSKEEVAWQFLGDLGHAPDVGSHSNSEESPIIVTEESDWPVELSEVATSDSWESKQQSERDEAKAIAKLRCHCGTVLKLPLHRLNGKPGRCANCKQRVAIPLVKLTNVFDSSGRRLRTEGVKR